MAQDRVDQRAIAEAVGVSACTVAKVLRHDPLYRVSPETRENIFRLAKEKGYQPRRRRTGNIAFVLCGEANVAEDMIHLSMCKSAAKVNRRVFLVPMARMPSYREVSLLVNPLSADGAIVSGFFEPELPIRLSKVLPTLVIGEQPDVEGVDRVWPDTVKLAERLTSRLTEAGHRSIALIVHSTKDLLPRLQIQGYKSALEKAGLSFDPALVWAKERRNYPLLVQEVLDATPKATALLACTVSDHALILSALFQLGCNVPEDMSYVGWECPTFTSSLAAFPAIVALDGLCEAIATTAMQRLLDRMENRDLDATNSIVEVGCTRGDTISEANNQADWLITNEIVVRR